MRSCRIITGERGSGKTSHLLSLGISQGFASVHIPDGYMLMDIGSGEKRLLMSSALLSPDTIGRWHYDRDVFRWAEEKLAGIYSGTVAIDEVGRLEVRGEGFASALALLLQRDVDLVITVRREFVQPVAEAFGIRGFSLEEF